MKKKKKKNSIHVLNTPVFASNPIDINLPEMPVHISGMRTLDYKKSTEFTEVLLCVSHHHVIQTPICMISI